MRGGRSFLVLLVLALGLGAYIYFVETPRDLTDPTAKKDKVFAVDVAKVDQIEIKAASGEVTDLKKNDKAWEITTPSGVDADQTSIAGVVSGLESLEIQKVLDENPTSVKDYGLDPARFSVAFKLAGETAMRRLNVGNKTPTGSDLYARVDGQPRLILIPAFAEDSLNRKTFDLRDKTALKFDRDKADGLAISVPGSPDLTFVKKGSDWRLQAPIDATADFSAVDGLIGRVSQLQMKDVARADAMSDLKSFGLDKPVLTATITTGSAKATLALGGPRDEATIYARDLSRPVVFAVEKTLLDDLKKKADDLRMKDIFEFRSFTAVGVDLTSGGTTYTFAKERTPAATAAPAAPGAPPVPEGPSEIWKQKKPTEKEANQTGVTDILNTLSTLRADKFADKVPASGDELVVVARFGDLAAPREERVTLRKSGDTVYALRAGEPGAAIIPTAEFDKALTQLKALVAGK